MKPKNKKKKGEKAEPVASCWSWAVAPYQDDEVSGPTDAQWGDNPSDQGSGW